MLNQKSLKDEMGILANLMSKSYHLEVAIVDENLNNLWGTPRFNRHIGLSVPNTCIAARVLETGDTVFSKDLKKNRYCSKCLNLSNCLFTIGMYFPIFSGDTISGTLCILGCEEQQRNDFLRYSNEIEKSGTTLGSFISSHLENNVTKQSNKVLFSSLEILIDLPEQNHGIIITDRGGQVVQVNQTASNCFKVKKSDFVGKNINSIIPEIDVSSKGQYPIKCQKTSLETKIQKIGIENNSEFEFGYLVFVKEKKSNMVGHGKLHLAEINNEFYFEDIISKSDEILSIKKLAKRIAATDSTVLILGETGVGKELFASGIHRASKRCKGNLVTLNCSAIPKNLLESEIFGYDEGAFTGAKKGGQPGKFEKADKGTIFLDEIGDMPLELQAKLLRVLETKEIQRLGSNNAKRVDVRLIAATNRDLSVMVENGSFRQDLFYRLNVVPVYIPPLRERKEDIPVLLEFFLQEYQNNLHSKVQQFSPDAVGLLQEYVFPGNVRELRNIVEYVMMIEEKEIADIKSFSHLLQNGQNYIPVTSKLSRNKKGKIEQALSLFGTSAEGKRKAAKHLGISLATLYRHLSSG